MKLTMTLEDKTEMTLKIIDLENKENKTEADIKKLQWMKAVLDND